MAIVIVYLAIAFLLAYLTESLTEYVIGTLFDRIEKLKPWKWIQLYFAMAVGIYLAIFYHLDLVYLLSLLISETVNIDVPIQASIVGFVLTGMGIGRGAGWLHDLVDRYFKKPEISVTDLGIRDDWRPDVE